jgi:hypothetical protein
MGSHYIPVGKIKIDKEILDIVCPAAGYGETPPPAEIYCPINGYIPDPTKYVDDPVIEESIKEPGVGEISILVGNPPLEDKVKFRCSVSNSGKYNVFIYGADNTLLSATLLNNNAYFDDFLPETGGIQADGFQMFNIVLAPEIAENNLSTFRIFKDTNFPGTQYIAVYFNAPGLTSLSDAFYQIAKLKVVEFLGDYNSLTNMHGCFEQTPDLLKVSMPGAFPVLADMSTCFATTPLLQEVILPSQLPGVTTMTSLFFNSGIGEVWLPASMPSLIHLVSAFNGAKRLKNVTLPVSAPNIAHYETLFKDCENLENAFNFPVQDATGITTIRYMAQNAYKLKGNFVFPEYQECNNVDYAFDNARSIKSIIFSGSMDSCTRIYGTFNNCLSLETLVLPESMIAITDARNLGNVASFNNLENLKTFILPKYLQNSSNWLNPNTNFLYSFTNAKKLETLSTVESAHPSTVGYALWNFLWNLKTFDQPNLKFDRINFWPNGGSFSKKGKLETVNLDFSTINGGFDVRYQNLSKTEVQRILNLLPKLDNSPASVYANFVGNPAGINSSNFGSSYNDYIYVSSNPGISVGDHVHSRQINYRQEVIFSDSGNVITHVDNNFNNFPLNNGDKVVFPYLNNVTGIYANEIYFVINADPVNFTFQISETLGGPVKSFTGDNTSKSSVTFECHVTSIDGNKIYIDRHQPYSTHCTGSITDLNIEQALFNGWNISIY